MTLIIFFSALTVGLVFVYAMWDIEDNWKRWCLYIVFFLALVVLREAEEKNGYNKGYREATCDMLDASGVTLDNYPEFCK